MVLMRLLLQPGMISEPLKQQGIRMRPGAVNTKA